MRCRQCWTANSAAACRGTGSSCRRGSGENALRCDALQPGGTRATVTYQQLRDYPATGGQATMRVSIRSPAAEAHLQRQLESLARHGVCQADFVVDGTTGTPYLIDPNPRLWGSLAQAIASGVDFPYLIYRMARRATWSPLPVSGRGVITRWLGRRARRFLSALAQVRREAAVR